MRTSVTLAAAAALAAAGAAIVLSAPAASAINCPDGTRPGPIATVGDRTVNGCVLTYGQCEPGLCSPPPTGAAPRD